MFEAAHQKPLLLGIFVLTYLGIAVGHVPRLKLNRVGIALLGAIAMMVCSKATARTAVGWIDWPTILLLFGFFVLSAQLALSGFYGRIADFLAAKLRSPARFLLVLMATTAGLSAFVNHDIVCYMFTPVVGLALARQQLNPIPFLIALALASNLGAAATLIGNAQGILIGEAAHLSFWHYMLWSIAPVTCALAVAYLWALWSVRRPSTSAVKWTGAEETSPEYPFDARHAAKGMVIFAAVIALFFTSAPKELVVLVAAGVHLASPKFRTEDLLGLVDWSLLVLFIALFVITGAFQATGYAELAVHGLQAIGLNPGRPTDEALLTAGATAVLNNAPAVMLLLKIVPLSQPINGYILALANSFGGSMFLTASVSNIVVVQQARRYGVKIGFLDFALLGVPVTVSCLALLIAWAGLVG